MACFFVYFPSTNWVYQEVYALSTFRLKKKKYLLLLGVVILNGTDTTFDQSQKGKELYIQHG